MITDNLANYMKKSEKGRINGVCPLDENGLVPLTRLNPNVLEFKGDWDALINNPVLSNGVSSSFIGHVYIVSVAGTQWTIDFEIGDFVIYDGSVWKKIPASASNTYLHKDNNLSDLANVATARTNLSVYSKAEVDTLKVSTISNTDTKLTIDNTTVSNPIVNVHNSLRWGSGAYRGLLYQFNNPNVVNGAQIAFNATLVSSITQVTIGWQPVNRGYDSDLNTSVKELWTFVKDNLPMKIRLPDPLNDGSYFTLNLTSYGGAGGFYYMFGCSYVSAETTMTNVVASGNNLYLLFDFTNKSYINAQDATLQSQITANTFDIATLNGNKLETLTSGNNFLTITGTGTSRALTVRSNTYLSGECVVASGGITVGGVAQTGHPFVATGGTTLTVLDDLIIDGSLTVNASNTLIVRGNLIVLGSFTGGASSVITCSGSISFNAKSSSDGWMTGGSFKSYDEFSVRDYSGSQRVYFTGTTSIDAKTISFINNLTPVFFESTTTHSLTADDILFSGNSNAGSNTYSTIRFYNVAVDCVSIKFKSNTSTNYVLDFQASNTITCNIFEATNNTNTTASGFAIYVNATTVTSDKYLMKSNSHSASGYAVYYTASAVIASKTVNFINNTTTSGSNAILAEADATINTDTIHIVTSGALQSISWGGNKIYGLYSTTRTPNYIINNTGATIAGFNKDSFLGVIPMAMKTISSYGSPYSFSMGATPAVNIIDTSFIWDVNANLISSPQFDGSTNKRITYIGLDKAYIHLTANFCFKSTSTPLQTYAFDFLKNGEVIPSARQHVSNKNGDGVVTVGVEAIVETDPNHYFELSAYISDVNGGPNPVSINLSGINWIVKKLNIM